MSFDESEKSSAASSSILLEVEEWNRHSIYAIELGSMQVTYLSTVTTVSLHTASSALNRILLPQVQRCRQLQQGACYLLQERAQPWE